MDKDQENLGKAQTRASMVRLLVGGVISSVLPLYATAASIDVGNDDVKLRWDNTFKYSNAFRLKERSSVLLKDAGSDDGNNSFGRGLVSNRVDVLSEFDASYKNLGFRISGTSWYDTVYNRANDNTSAATSNNVSVPYNQFTKETRDRMGRKAELMDAFVFGTTNIGGLTATGRVGRHSLVFGETLFFGANGIANAQGPVDLVRQVSVPSSQFKEILRPVNQVSGQLQITSDISLAAYYHLKWEKTILPPVGSYLSSSDVGPEGTERAGPWLIGKDIKPRNSGQGGMQLKYRASSIDTEFGFYAARYHSTAPQLYFTTDFTASPATPYSVLRVYHEGVRTYGTSASTTLFGANVAVEASVRENAPLTGGPVLVQYNAGANNGDNPAYAVGKTGHINVSSIYLLQASPFWQGGSFLMEMGWNRTLSVTKNPAALDPNTTRDAYALRALFSPSYFQIAPGLDISVPMGIGYTPKGRSSAVFGFNSGVEKGGDFSIGVTGTYQNVWDFGITYIGFFGKAAPLVTPPNSPTQMLSFGQSLKDRDFLSLYIKRTF